MPTGRTGVSGRREAAGAAP